MYVPQPIDTAPVNRAVTAALDCRGIAEDLPAGLTLEREARAVARCSDDLWAVDAAACDHLRSLARRANASAHIRAEDDRRPAGSPPIPTPQGDRMRGYFWAQVLLTVRAQLGVTEPEALAREDRLREASASDSATPYDMFGTLCYRAATGSRYRVEPVDGDGRWFGEPAAFIASPDDIESGDSLTLEEVLAEDPRIEFHGYTYAEHLDTRNG